MTPYPTPHRSIPAPGLHSEVSLIPVHHLTLPAQVHPAVMDIRRSRLQLPDEAEVDIRLGVQLESIAGPASLLSPAAIPAPPGPGLTTPRLIRVGMTGIRRDERCVLDNAFLDAEALFVQLPL